MTEELLTVGEAAKKLSVSARTIQRYCKNGLLNHKWIHGKRHKELRIVPPIPLALLPGVKYGTAPGASDLATKKEMEELIASFSRELTERDHRINILEKELSRLTTIIPGSAGRESLFPADDPNISRKVESILDEYESVRPVEQKLILKLASELQSHSKFLRKLGLEKNTEEG